MKNYTSAVPAQKSIANIEHQLIRAGVNYINKAIDKPSKEVIGITFEIEKKGRPIVFLFRSKVDAVYKTLIKQKRRVNAEVERNTKEQAKRAAWKSLAELIELTVDKMLLEEVELAEVFLGYVYDARINKTFFESIEENNYKLLK